MQTLPSNRSKTSIISRVGGKQNTTAHNKEKENMLNVSNISGSALNKSANKKSQQSLDKSKMETQSQFSTKSGARKKSKKKEKEIPKHLQIWADEVKQEMEIMKTRESEFPFEMMKEKYQKLQTQYTEMLREMQHINDSSLSRIVDQSFTIKQLIQERDELIQQNIVVEDEQIRLLQTNMLIHKDIVQKQEEVNSLRLMISLEDQANVGERKEIEYELQINLVKKNESNELYKELQRLRGIDHGIQSKIDETRNKNNEIKNKMKENDKHINEVCDQRCKETEDVAAKIQKDIQSNQEKTKYKQQIIQLENEIEEQRDNTKKIKEIQSFLYKKLHSIYQNEENGTLMINSLILKMQELVDQELRIQYDKQQIQSSIHNQGIKESDLRLVIARLNREAVDSNNRNYHLEKERQQFLQIAHDSALVDQSNQILI